MEPIAGLRTLSFVPLFRPSWFSSFFAILTDLLVGSGANSRLLSEKVRAGLFYF